MLIGEYEEERLSQVVVDVLEEMYGSEGLVRNFLAIPNEA